MLWTSFRWFISPIIIKLFITMEQIGRFSHLWQYIWYGKISASSSINQALQSEHVLQPEGWNVVESKGNVEIREILKQHIVSNLAELENENVFETWKRLLWKLQNELLQLFEVASVGLYTSYSRTKILCLDLRSAICCTGWDRHWIHCYGPGKRLNQNVDTCFWSSEAGI